MRLRTNYEDIDIQLYVSKKFLLSHFRWQGYNIKNIVVKRIHLKNRQFCAFNYNLMQDKLFASFYARQFVSRNYFSVYYNNPHSLYSSKNIKRVFFDELFINWLTNY